MRRALIGLCAFLGACSSTAPSSTALDGQWSGTTAQGMPIAFTISPEQKVTSIAVGYSFNGCSGTKTFSNLNLATTPEVICVPGPCSGTISSFKSFAYLAGSIGEPMTQVNGLFASTTRAEGQVAFRDYPGCGTALGIGWTASK